MQPGLVVEVVKLLTEVVTLVIVIVTALFTIMSHQRITKVETNIDRVEIKNGELADLLKKAFDRGMIQEREDVAAAVTKAYSDRKKKR